MQPFFVQPPDAGSLFLDLSPRDEDPLREILNGMRSASRRLPSKLFYDERGSALFDEITRLDEYYLTRTELSVLRDNLDEIVSVLPTDLVLLEYGSGSSTKTDILLSGLSSIRAYVPIDISREHLLLAASGLSSRFPDLVVLPVCADYSSQIDLGFHESMSGQLAVFFPGSTIGNFEEGEAIGFMSRIRSMIGSGGALMMGVDLKKDVNTLLAAYNDSRGITEAFNKNILSHINARFSADFDEELFNHVAVYNEEAGRIEMYLESDTDQTVSIDGHHFQLDSKELIGTEYSHKYSAPDFARLAGQAGFDVTNVWTDSKNLFSFQLLIAR